VWLYRPAERLNSESGHLNNVQHRSKRAHTCRSLRLRTFLGQIAHADGGFADKDEAALAAMVLVAGVLR
jgi:hypothetical protein